MNRRSPTVGRLGANPLAPCRSNGWRERFSAPEILCCLPLWGGFRTGTVSKGIGWAVYAAGFVIWLFGYLSAGHAQIFDWRADTPWWISGFVPNLKQNSDLC
jgi:hypothetical protein